MSLVHSSSKPISLLEVRDRFNSKMVLASSSHEVSSYTVSCSNTLQQASTTPYISSTMTIASPRFVSSTSTVTCSKTIPQPIITEVYAQMHLRLHCKLFQCHIQEFKRGLSNLILRVQSTDYCDQSSIIFNRSNVHC